MWGVVALSIGLAMDATAVAAARGLGRTAPRDAVVLPLLFGGFQAGMAAVGWALGAWGGKYVADWDHWIAGALLVLIGGKMIVEGLRAHEGSDVRTDPLLYLGLAVATSIDAFAAGVTLPLLDASPWVALLAIGAITAVFTLAGYFAGNAMGRRFGSRLEILGGVVLVGLAVKLVIEHTMY
jgi:manganese efflux pump family protein